MSDLFLVHFVPKQEIVFASNASGNSGNFA